MTDSLILLELIDDNPYQTRQTYDPESIAELAADIYARGLLQPPVGRQVDGRVQLAFGHRRLRAYRHIRTQIDRMGWSAMPVNVQTLTDEQMALAAWSENAQRKDVTAIEEAQAIKRMMDGFGWSQSDMGSKLGVDRSTVANKLRLLRLPEEVQGRIAGRELSERQAVALLPLYELPQPALNNAEKSYSYPRPHEVIENAGAKSSDRIREDVDRILHNATQRLDVPWVDWAFDERGLKEGKCDGCAERVRFEKAFRCPHQTCHERKTALWAALRVEWASAVMDIPAAPLELSYSEYASLANVPQPDQVVAKHCPNLRLRWTGDDRQTVIRLRVTEYPDVEIICLHGKDGRCKCASAAKAAATKADPDIQEQKALEKRIQTEIIEPARAAVLEGLQSGHLGVWRELATTVSYGVRLRDDADLDAIREAAAKGLADRSVYYGSDKTNLGAVKQAYEARLKNLGLAVPWAVPPEEDLRRRYERINRWAINQEWWKWDYETSLEVIAGNQVNLAALAAEAAALGKAAGELPLLIGALQQQLAELEPVAREINERRQGAGNWWGRNAMPRVLCHELLTLEPGSLHFEKVLSEAEAIHVRYALIFASGLDRIEALCDRRMQLEPERTGEAIPVL
jgi:ParB/RepB/Spo0J family partition protein